MRLKINTSNKKIRKQARGSYLSVSNYGKVFVYINPSRYMWWQYRQNLIPDAVANTISHEQIHLTLENISHKASVELDNLFSVSDNWARDSHGLGNLNRRFKEHNSQQ